MPTHRRHPQTNAPASVFRSHMAINKDGRVLFSSLPPHSPGNETSLLFNCTKFTLRRVRATIQSVGDPGLRGLHASRGQDLRPCSPEPACLAGRSPRGGEYTGFLSRGGQPMRAGVSFSVHLCSASLSKGTLGAPPRPAAAPPHQG